jgi:hypothetical protein
LEDLEGRTLLSTYTLSEFYSYFAGSAIPAVKLTVDNTTTYYFNPPSPFVVTTSWGNNSVVTILDTSAHIPVEVDCAGPSDVHVGSQDNVRGILADVNIYNCNDYNQWITVDDSFEGTWRNVTLSTVTSWGLTYGSITGLAPAAINYDYNPPSTWTSLPAMPATTSTSSAPA